MNDNGFLVQCVVGLFTFVNTLLVVLVGWSLNRLWKSLEHGQTEQWAAINELRVGLADHREITSGRYMGRDEMWMLIRDLKGELDRKHEQAITILTRIAGSE